MNETAKAQWGEVDLAGRVLGGPGGAHEDGRKPHQVPLADRALAIFQTMKQVRVSQYVFPGIRTGQPLSGMAMLMQLRRMRGGGLTVHGFRSSFKDWTLEQTDYPDFLSEMVLGHISGDKVRAAYARSELMGKRRELMAAWAKWCQTNRRHR